MRPLPALLDFLRTGTVSGAAACIFAMGYGLAAMLSLIALQGLIDRFGTGRELVWALWGQSALISLLTMPFSCLMLSGCRANTMSRTSRLAAAVFFLHCLAVLPVAHDGRTVLLLVLGWAGPALLGLWLVLPRSASRDWLVMCQGKNPPPGPPRPDRASLFWLGAWMISMAFTWFALTAFASLWIHSISWIGNAVKPYSLEHLSPSSGLALTMIFAHRALKHTFQEWARIKRLLLFAMLWLGMIGLTMPLETYGMAWFILFVAGFGILWHAIRLWEQKPQAGNAR